MSKTFQNVGYTASRCPSGLWHFLPTGEPVPPADLTRRLDRRRPLVLLAQLSAIGVPPLKTDLPMDYLCDWYPENRIADLSPALIGPGNPYDRFELIEKGWGKNALVCLYAKSPRPELLAHLRSVVRGQERPDVPPPEGQVVGFYYPNILAGMLEHGESDVVDFWFTGVSAVLIEANDPWRWQAFAGPSFREALEHIGFQEKKEEDSKARA